MVDKALDALRFSKNATTKLIPFEAHHGRETNTVLRKLTKKPSMKNLNWEIVLQQKCLCLDENDHEVNTIAFPKHSNWEKRSDLVYAPALWKAPLILDCDQQLVMHQREESEVEPTIQGSGDAGDLYQRTTSEDYQPLKIIPARLPVEISARHEAIAAGQAPSSSRIIQEEHGAGTSVKTKNTKVNRRKGNQDWILFSVNIDRFTGAD